jgi:hypothetical protein
MHGWPLSLSELRANAGFPNPKSCAWQLRIFENEPSNLHAFRRQSRWLILIGSGDSGGMRLSERTGERLSQMLLEDRKRRRQSNRGAD